MDNIKLEDMNHHQEIAKEHQALLQQLKLARQFKEKKRAHWKTNSTSDSARFQFQDAIGIVNQLEKKLWKFL